MNRKLLSLVLILVLVFLAPGCGSSSTNQNEKNNPPQVVTLQDLATKNNSTVGELNKVYRMDISNRYSDGSNMIINFQSVSSVKSATKGGSTFNNFISIINVPPLNLTREMINNAGSFELYDEYGKSTAMFSVTTGPAAEDLSEIVLYSEKDDLTKYKYLSFGPMDGANKTILFEIKAQ
ncbi:hypothetical protein [Desulfitobacterium hafniense]|uniref:hypothetical protein n=1 Tax=Desulfitobacterium hafniense TaxID=49338 RepID=UPI00059DF124|nr:hypothetical protein [Desulfitobacterium hafniense]